MVRRLLAGAAAAVAVALHAVPAAACGALVAADGSVRLDRATTFVAWSGGVEHYLTSFAFQGAASRIGWLVPLPAVPTSVVEGGAWTLQRLQRETHPLADGPLALSAKSAAGAPAQVVLTTTVEALDITVIRGTGQGVLDWAATNGFALPDDARAHILMYAHASPVFMAARYNLDRAQQTSRVAGDGTPVLITMPSPRLWVPLEVLSNDLDPVHADIYLLTDGRPSSGEEVPLPVLGASSVGDTLPGAPGLLVRDQRPMNDALHHDLAGDRNMGWVPATGWLTYLSLDAPSPAVTYDMSVTRDGLLRLASLGAGPAAASKPAEPAFAPRRHLTGAEWAVAALGAGGLAGSVGVVALWRRRSAH